MLDEIHKLPFDRTPDHFKLRSELFGECDNNKDGVLDIDECKATIISKFQLSNISNIEKIIEKAFDLSKELVSPTKRGEAGSLGRFEFRVFL